MRRFLTASVLALAVVGTGTATAQAVTVHPVRYSTHISQSVPVRSLPKTPPAIGTPAPIPAPSGVRPVSGWHQAPSIGTPVWP